MPFFRNHPEGKAEIERQVHEMLENDINEPSDSSWHSSVKKKNGEFIFAIDYRKVKKITPPGIFPLPRLEGVGRLG